MKYCPNCGKVVPKDKNFCESCGSSVDFPGIRDNGPKKVQNNGKNSKNDNKEEIEILDTNVKKQEKYCRICGKELEKKGICKECESSTYMSGIEEQDKYKFCENCGHELLENSNFCVECGHNLGKTKINSNDNNSNPGAAVFLSIVSLLFFIYPFLISILDFNLGVGFNYLLSLIFIIIARISDTKNVCAKVIMWIEIAFIILGILFWYFIIRSCENSCRGLNN